MSAGSLPPPQILDRLPSCPRCDYDLSATDISRPCPECGQVNSACVQLAGTPNRLGGGMHRRVARVVAVVGAWIGLQAIMVLWFRVSLLIGLLVLAAFALGLVWLLVSSPRERRAAEKFLIVSGAIIRLPLTTQTGAFTDALRVTMQPGDTLHLRPIGLQWARVRLMRPDGSTPFDAGFLVDITTLTELAASLQNVVGAGVRVDLEHAEP